MLVLLHIDWFGPAEELQESDESMKKNAPRLMESSTKDARAREKRYIKYLLKTMVESMMRDSPDEIKEVLKHYSKFHT